MSAEFSTVKAPPRTLDSMDEWGALESLPWSLDSGIWNGAGLYALTGAQASAAGTGRVSCMRIRTQPLHGQVSAAGAVAGNAEYALKVQGTAFSREEELGGITVGIPVQSAVAVSGGAADFVRIRPGGGQGAAHAQQQHTPYRVRMSPLAPGAAWARQSAADNRVRTVHLHPSEAWAAEEVSAGYKGWNWKALPREAETTWKGAVEWNAGE